MGALRDIFVKDGSTGVITERTWSITNDANGEKVGEVIARLHYDFSAGVTHVAFYVPDMPGVLCAEALVLKEVPTVLKWSSEVPISLGLGADKVDGQHLPFSGQVAFYSERPVRGAHKAQMTSQARVAGYRLAFKARAD